MASAVIAMTPVEIERVLAETRDMAAIYATRPNPYLVTAIDEMRARRAAEAIDHLAKRLAHLERAV